MRDDQKKRLVVCCKCKCTWYDDGFNPIECPYCLYTQFGSECTLAKVRIEQLEALLRKAHDSLLHWNVEPDLRRAIRDLFPEPPKEQSE